LNLFEYEAKQEFAKYGIPVPKGNIITDSKMAEKAITDLKPPYMVKSQVLAGGRGKAGGIIAADSLREVIETVDELLGERILGLSVKQVLIEEKLSIRKELYLGITIDRYNRSYIVLTSERGGIEIEDVAERTPKEINRTGVDSQLGVGSFHALAIAKQLGYRNRQLLELSTIIQRLYRVCLECDAEIVEINPLAEIENGNFFAVDARMVIDDNALFRHPQYAAEDMRQLSPQEALASKNNLAYVKLDGNIGVVGNGAGLVMATLDLLNLFGGKPADFLDLGGGASIKAIEVALQIVLADPQAKVLLVNILGGITHCDDVARSIVKVLKEAKIKKTLIIRLVGTNQKEGQEILRDSGISISESMEQAARHAIEIAKVVNSNGYNS
jgi:succinyl-CoA synthetase beta subunit